MGAWRSVPGCRWEIGDEKGVLQPGTLMYKMAGVDIARYEQVSQPERERLAQKGIEEGCLYVNNLLARPLPSGTIYSNMSRIRIDSSGCGSVEPGGDGGPASGKEDQPLLY